MSRPDATARFEIPPPRTRVRADNLSTMLFVAALFHGVVILGVSFNAGNSEPDGAATTSMEVILLTRDYEKRPDISDAEYLAQQNLAGAGGAPTAETVRVAYGARNAPAAPGPEQQGSDTPASARTDPSSAYLYANSDSAEQQGMQNTQSAPERVMQTGMPGTANTVEILAAPDTVTAIKGAQPRQLLISARTRESRIAAYLDGWKRRVERVGTLNFPRIAEARAGSRNPVLEVSIAADGSLQQAIILQTSGVRELDMAAVDILKLAAPFDPFPEYLQNDYDELKFSYEWRFTGQQVGNMRVPQ
ncbi:MAG: energy transducer TonB [Gammaproteobacteria bacterium]|jgi:protein TonB|nr:energy transducer TonB [Gammaproteobacteria bacterium]